MADENTLLNSDLESRYEKYKGIIKNFTLMSDIFMRNVFKKRECLEYVLQALVSSKVPAMSIREVGPLKSNQYSECHPNRGKRS